LLTQKTELPRFSTVYKEYPTLCLINALEKRAIIIPAEKRMVVEYGRERSISLEEVVRV
jgi:hypothetical protein